MFREKIKQRHVQRRILIALVLLCLVVLAINLHLCLECNVVARIVDNTNKMQREKNLFVGYYNRV